MSAIEAPRSPLEVERGSGDPAAPDAPADAPAPTPGDDEAAPSQPTSGADPAGDERRSRSIRVPTFLVISLVTVGFAIFTGVVLVVPYFELSSAVVAKDSGIDRGCAIYFATHLFHAFCIYSVRFLGALSGGVIALSGALFILNRLQGGVTFTGEQKDAVKLSLQTASPGLAMVLFGALLVVAAMYREQSFEPPGFMCTSTGQVEVAASSLYGVTPVVPPEEPPRPEGCMPELGCEGDASPGARVGTSDEPEGEPEGESEGERGGEEVER